MEPGEADTAVDAGLAAGEHGTAAAKTRDRVSQKDLSALVRQSRFGVVRREIDEAWLRNSSSEDTAKSVCLSVCLSV
jgi:hypothetical protein